MLVLEITEKFQIHLMAVSTDSKRSRDGLTNAFMNVHQMFNHLYGLYNYYISYIYIYIYIYTISYIYIQPGLEKFEHYFTSI